VFRDHVLGGKTYEERGRSRRFQTGASSGAKNPPLSPWQPATVSGTFAAIMPLNTETISSERIESSILIIRGHKVILDSDLAVLYGVNVGRLNEAVKRNRDVFPRTSCFS
jgi:hypothetical protein